MWGSVETTAKLGLTGLAGFTLACVVIETAGTFIGTAVAGSSNGQNYFVTRCVEIKFYGAFRAESSRRPPRHRRGACSMAWRCRFLTAQRSQHGCVIADTD